MSKGIKNQGEKPTTTEVAACLVKTALLLSYDRANQRAFLMSWTRFPESSTRTFRVKRELCDQMEIQEKTSTNDYNATNCTFYLRLHVYEEIRHAQA